MRRYRPARPHEPEHRYLAESITATTAAPSLAGRMEQKELDSHPTRWKSYGAQWAMVLGGGQSALAGTFFIAQAQMPMPPSISNVAGYAAVGAFYFLVSAVWLSVSQWRKAA